MEGRVSKVSPGQAFRPKAREWNSFADAANWLMDTRSPVLSGAPNDGRFSAGVVWVTNTGTTTLRQYGVVGLGTLAGRVPSGTSWQPADVSNVVFSIEAVSASAPWAILQSPCSPGQIVKAVVSGPTPCYFASGFSGTTAGPSAGTDTLTDGAGANVLWQSEAVGEQLGFVSIGTGGSSVVPSASGLYFVSIWSLAAPDSNGVSVATGVVHTAPVGGTLVPSPHAAILVTGVNADTFSFYKWYQFARLAAAYVESMTWTEDESTVTTTAPAYCVLNTLHVLG